MLSYGVVSEEKLDSFPSSIQVDLQDGSINMFKTSFNFPDYRAAPPPIRP